MGLFKHKEKNVGPVYIDGNSYVVRLLTGGAEAGVPNEWDSVLKTLEWKLRLPYFSGVASWCQDSAVPPVGYEPMYSVRVVRGFETTRDWSRADSQMRMAKLVFRPVLEPVDPETMQPNPDLLSDIEDGIIVTRGTLYVGKTACVNPQNPVPDGDIPSYTSLKKIGRSNIYIGDSLSDEDKLIRWVKCGGLLVADRGILNCVSWEDLKKNRLV